MVDIDNIAFVLILGALLIGVLICLRNMALDLIAWLASSYDIGPGELLFALIIGAIIAVLLIWAQKVIYK